MNGLDGTTGWRTLKQRLSFRVLGCCGSTWTPPRSPGMLIAPEDDDIEEEEEEEEAVEPTIHTQVTNVGPTSGMNLAMALAAERNVREEANVGPVKNAASGQFKTLIRLIEETDGVDLMKKSNKGRDDVEDGSRDGNDWMCCVCMERNKGAAFIPCGHTFCRVCSRELWVRRGYCPICSRSILEILDIF